jgi:hypothetical protein
VTASGCHANVREVQGEGVCWCTGTRNALCAGWASDVYGRDLGHLVRGIDKGGLCEASGELMGREMVGCVLAKRACPRWPWRWPGRRGVLARGLCKVGLVLGCQQGGDR